MAQNTQAEQESPSSATEPIEARPVGGTEFSWCKAVPVGTGVTVLSLLLSKPPQIPILQNALHNLQNSHPILRSKLHLDPSNNTFHFITPPSPNVHIQPFDLPSTAQILQAQPNAHHDDPFHTLLQHEMNQDTWRHPSARDTNVLYANTYTITNDRYAVFLRLHTAACDRASAVALLKELLRLVGGGGGAGYEGKEEKVNLPVEDLIPEGKMNKPFWARGLDVLGYSLNALRFSNLSFVDAASPRRSSLVRLQMDADDTNNLLAECKSRGIKLCGALAAAGMIAAWTSKCLPNDQREKYAVVTLVDCRPLLDPVLPSSHAGFYHSAILNTHDVCGENETLWELAKRSYTAFVNAINCNKHFTDMSDLNYLMCKAIENPGLTPLSSLRTALISVFEDPVFDDSAEMHEEIGLEDYVGCASAHGVGPSIAIFDTIRNGKLDCACIYPSPLHSKEQIQGLVDNMKRILVEGCKSENQQIEP